MGQQRRARAPSTAQVNELDFMRTPDAGAAGYVVMATVVLHVCVCVRVCVGIALFLTLCSFSSKNQFSFTIFYSFPWASVCGHLSSFNPTGFVIASKMSPIPSTRVMLRVTPSCFALRRIQRRMSQQRSQRNRPVPGGDRPKPRPKPKALPKCKVCTFFTAS